MKTIVLKHNEYAEIVDIGEELEDIQDIVGGYIEIVYISEKFTKNNIIVICNEEGKLKNLLPSLLRTSNEEIKDVIAGNVIICGEMYDESGEKILCSLTEKQIKFVLDSFGLCFIEIDVDSHKSKRKCYYLEI